MTPYREPVEHVMHGGASESPPEVFPVSCLRHGHQDAGDGRPNVRPHDDRDGQTYG